MPDASSPKLLDQVRQAIRRKHYSIRTEDAYVNWIRRFILFHEAKQGFARHPAEMGIPEIESFLTDLAVNEKVAASTQNQALSALLFLYKEVLQIELDGKIQASARQSSPAPARRFIQGRDSPPPGGNERRSSPDVSDFIWVRFASDGVCPTAGQRSGF